MCTTDGQRFFLVVFVWILPPLSLTDCGKRTSSALFVLVKRYARELSFGLLTKLLTVTRGDTGIVKYALVAII